MTTSAVGASKKQALEENRAPRTNRPLPADCWEHALSYLPVTEIVSSGAVCSTLRNVRDRAIRNLYARVEANNETLSAILSYLCTSTKANNYIRCLGSWSALPDRERSQIKELLLANLPAKQPKVGYFKECAQRYNETGLPRLQLLLGRITLLRLQETPILDEITNEILGFMPGLTALTLTDRSLGLSLRVKKIASQCSNLTALTLNADSIRNVTLDEISFSKLEKCRLNFHFFVGEREPTRQGIEKMLTRLPALREIEITESLAGSNNKIPHPLHDVALGLLAQRDS